MRHTPSTLRNALCLSTMMSAVLTVAASPAPGIMRVPEQHRASVIDTSEALVKSAYDGARENSPFALFTTYTGGQDQAQADSHEAMASQLSQFASQFLGTRYKLGAAGPSRFDCSGFVGYVYRNFGYPLHRDSRSQYSQGQGVERTDLRPGDLLFFSSRSSGKGRVGHVAMVTEVNDDGTCTFIHASSSRKGVVTQSFPDGGYYSKHYIGARRIIGNM